MNSITIIIAGMMLFFGSLVYADDTEKKECPEGMIFDEVKQECVLKADMSGDTITPKYLVMGDDTDDEDEDIGDDDDDLDDEGVDE